MDGSVLGTILAGGLLLFLGSLIAFGGYRLFLVLLPIYGVIREPWMLLVIGPAVAFFGTGYYSGFGAVIAELYPTSIRATAAGVGYNVGRIASAAAPFVVGSLAGTAGFGLAFAITGAAFLGAALMWIGIPATGNRELAA